MTSRSDDEERRKINDEERRKYIGRQIEYWRQLGESDGFDLKNDASVPIGLNTFNLERYGAKCRGLLTMRYARVGLQCYNMSHGTKLELHHIRKFNQTMSAQSTYYFTLAASDPATSSLVTLQLGVAEGCRTGTCSLNVACFIARLKGAPHESGKGGIYHHEGIDDFQFPYWPSDFNDSQRFYVFEDSELQENDWIPLYLELVLCTNDIGTEEPELSNLQILKVAKEAIETNEAPDDVIASNVYIMFKGFANARVGELGEHVERKIIVRRNFNERTGCLTLLGEYGFYVGEVAEKRFISRPNEWAATMVDLSECYDDIFNLPIIKQQRKSP